jgi:hypothetical protein
MDEVLNGNDSSIKKEENSIEKDDNKSGEIEKCDDENDNYKKKKEERQKVLNSISTEELLYSLSFEQIFLVFIK